MIMIKEINYLLQSFDSFNNYLFSISLLNLSAIKVKGMQML